MSLAHCKVKKKQWSPKLHFHSKHTRIIFHYLRHRHDREHKNTFFSKQNSYVNQLFGQCMITSAANTVIPFIISASLRLASPLLCGEIKTCQPACRQATSQVSVIVFQFTLGAAGAELTLRKHPTSKSSLH